MVKHLPTNPGDAGSIPGSGRCPGVGNDSILARKIPWTEEPGGLQSTGSQSIGHSLATEHAHAHTMITSVARN